MTPGDVADRLKFAEQTMYRLAEVRQVPASRVGAKWQFFWAETDGWQENRTSVDSGEN
jgi:hypothetical protein